MPPQRRHIPRRTCLGCRVSDDRNRLLRLSVDSRRELKVDPSGEGRGGYLHRNPECWQAFLRRKSIPRAFRAEIDRAAKEKLIQYLRYEFESDWE